jgi:hypothetical protein
MVLYYINQKLCIYVKEVLTLLNSRKENYDYGLLSKV